MNDLKVKKGDGSAVWVYWQGVEITHVNQFPEQNADLRDVIKYSSVKYYE